MKYKSTPTPNKISNRNISINLSALKGYCAVIVMLGHLGTGIPNFWVVVSSCLLVFSISSGYFTALKYGTEGTNFSWKTFWSLKFKRLVPQLLVIDIFLFFLFLCQGKNGLWSWHTIINILGLNGFLNWLRIPNVSPYGAGMWFLTLLLLFYIFFPLLIKWFHRSNPFIPTILFLSFFFVLHKMIPYGHDLWLTATGFIVGIFFARTDFRINVKLSISFCLISVVGMLITHYLFKFDSLNFFWILLCTSAGFLILFDITLPHSAVSFGAWLSGMLLEIYLLHPYFVMEPTGIAFLNKLIAVLLVVSVAFLLSFIGNFCRKSFTFSRAQRG